MLTALKYRIGLLLTTCIASIDKRNLSKFVAQRRGGLVLNVSDSQSSGPGFESHSDISLDLFLGSPMQVQILDQACK